MKILSQMISGMILLVASGSADVQPEGSLTEEPIDLKITGPARPSEGLLSTYAVVLTDRRVRRSAGGYSPSVPGIPARWTEPPQVTWDFGDGTGPIDTGDQLTVGHRYQEQGTYRLTVSVADSAGIYATAQRQVDVRNRKPLRVRLAASRGDRSGEMVFTASAYDVPDDSLNYVWDLGDGTSLDGIDQWQVTHQYIDGGQYTVQLRVFDDDGAEASKELRIAVSGSSAGSTQWQEIDEEDIASEAAINGLKGTVTGQFAFDNEAQISSLGGVYLSPLRSGVCRFMFTSWDPTHLAHGLFLLDFPVLPKNGGRFRFDAPRVNLTLEQDKAAYRLNQRVHGGGAVGRILGGGGFASEPIAEVSPLGIEENIGYSTESGYVEVDFVPGVYLRGRYELTLRSADEDWSNIGFSGKFALDLSSPSGWVTYDRCRDGEPLTITSRYPQDQSEHIRVERPPLRVRFDQTVDPESINERTVQLGYTAADGQFVRADGRLLRSDRGFWLVPNANLKHGVRYQIRVKGGEQGVRGATGAPFEAADGEEWAHWSFRTRIDFETQNNGRQLLSCHLYQTIRDAPLIAGKPAVARVSADWLKQPDIAADGQYREFDTRVVLLHNNGSELAGEWYRFIRPDQWPQGPESSAPAEQSAWVTVPAVPNDLTSVRAHLQVRTEPGGEPKTVYSSRCPMERWEHAPRLTVDVFALRANEWLDEETYQAALPTVGRLLEALELYAWQQLPVQEITVKRQIESIVPLNKAALVTWIANAAGQLTDAEAAAAYASDVQQQLRERSDADVVLLLAPHGLVSNGGMIDPLERGQIVAYSIVRDDPAYFGRYVYAAVHEIAHGLSLHHVPYVESDEARARLTTALNDDILGVQAWFRGIDGLRMSRDGSTHWLKSSQEGNAQSTSLAPLMYPRTVSTDIAFVAHHQYRQMQKYWEYVSSN